MQDEIMHRPRRDTDPIEARLDLLLADAEPLAQKTASYLANLAEWDTQNPKSPPPDDLNAEEAETLVPFTALLESIYLSTVCLLDSLGLYEYLKQFHKKFGGEFDRKFATEFSVDDYSYFPQYNDFLSEIRRFLSPLRVAVGAEYHERIFGVQYLENFLKNTDAILKLLKRTAQSEPKIYNSVKEIIHLVFPSAIDAKSKFLKTAQEYKPDVLVPELRAAVEYKYADSEEKLKATIASISDDVKGYTGDSDYELFYAVLYTKGPLVGEPRIRRMWEEKEFPANWRFIHVIGS